MQREARERYKRGLSRNRRTEKNYYITPAYYKIINGTDENILTVTRDTL